MINKLGRMKGQSAIEYLTTYGWMLLVVAIVGGAIFSTVQGQSNIQTVSGFSGAAVGVDTFALTGDGRLAMEITAQGNDPVEVTEVSMYNPATEESASTNASEMPTEFIPLGESASVYVEGVSSGDSSSEHNINISYNSRSLDGLQATGSLTGSFDLSG